jgi:outer membrane receptor protein involved in Fe transport
VDATYQSTFVVSADSNSSADANGDITVRPGNRIPLIPRHTGRLALDYDFDHRWDIGGTLILASGSYLHGNENNANVAGGTNGEGNFISPTGTGWIPSYAVLNLQATCHLGKHVDLFGKLVNALNKQYATAGFLTSDSFEPNGAFRADPATYTNENAVSPATPRAIWAGVRLHL